jgi:hypothetical protein
MENKASRTGRKRIPADSDRLRTKVSWPNEAALKEAEQDATQAGVSLARLVMACTLTRHANPALAGTLRLVSGGQLPPTSAPVDGGAAALRAELVTERAARAEAEAHASELENRLSESEARREALQERLAIMEMERARAEEITGVQVGTDADVILKAMAALGAKAGTWIFATKILDAVASGFNEPGGGALLARAKSLGWVTQRGQQYGLTQRGRARLEEVA